MKGRQQGRPTKWVTSFVKEPIGIGKPGVEFDVWKKWKRKQVKLGTLIVSVGGLRWKPIEGKFARSRNWEELAEWFK